ncbi:hypothetical protein FI667_g2674, partial [Globisporangium splendens]
MEATTMSEYQFAEEFRAVTLASERLLLCVCGCTDKDDARMLAAALTKIANIKLQMNTEHEIGIACFGDTSMTVLQQVGAKSICLYALHGALDRMTEGEGAQDAGSMDDLLRDAGAYFSRSIETQSNGNTVYRLVFVYKHDPESPRLRFQQSDASMAFLSNARFHLDAIYWHKGIPNDDAQVRVCASKRELCLFAY